MKRLTMKHVVVILVTPDKPNVVHTVAINISIEALVTPVVSLLIRNDIKAQSIAGITTVAAFYGMFKKKLGIHFTTPARLLDLTKYRVVDLTPAVL